MPEHPIEAALAAMGEMTGWTEAECRNFLACLRGPTPEALLASIPEAVEYAMRVERASTFVALMKRLGPVIEAEWRDGDLHIRLTPEAEVTEGEDGASLNIRWHGFLGPKDERP